MAIASSDRVVLRRKTTAESSWGETPASPAMSNFGVTSATLESGKTTAQSQQIRSDRMLADIIQTGFSASGSFGLELIYGEYDWAFESLFGSTFNTLSLTGSSNISFGADPYNNITGAGVDVTNVVVGSHIKVSGTTSNNGYFRVLGKNANFISVDGPLVSESNTSAIITGSNLKMGTSQISYLIEQEFSDVTQFKYVTGARISQVDIAIQSRSIITGTVNFLAKLLSRDTTTRAGSTAAASTNPAMNASTSVGTIKESGSTLSTALRSLNFSINGNLRPQDQIGSTALAQIADGTFALTGTVDAYFQDAVLYAKALNHSDAAISFHTTDDDGNKYIWQFPAIKLTGDPNAPGQNQDVGFSLNFEAKLDELSGTMAMIDRFAA